MMKNPMNYLNTGACSYRKALFYYIQDKILKTLKTFFMMLITFFLVVPLSFSQKRIASIDSILIAFHNEGKLNGNVLIAENGQIIYNRSFGYANETTKEKLNENSVFCLASVSKQFTALAIVILKEQGKLNYDDKLTKYIPELTAYDNISIRNMLQHTSGLPDFEQLMNSKDAMEYLSTRTGGNILTNQDVIAFFSRYKPELLSDPGTKFAYCDIGYVFLGSIIERISGTTYAEFINQKIFTPLEMSSTFVLSPETRPKNIKNFAWGYKYSDSLKKFQSTDSLLRNKLQVMSNGPSGIYSTVHDLLKWDRALYTGKLVSSSSLQEMFEPTILNDNTISYYGFGWSIGQDPFLGKSVYHSGEDRGYISYIDRNIDHDKTIIILENRDHVINPVVPINNNLYEIVFPNEVKLSQQQLDALSGTYEVQQGFDLKIWSENGKIYGQATGQNVLPLYAENELLLFAKVTIVKIQFEKNKKEKIASLYILQHGDKIRAEKK